MHSPPRPVSVKDQQDWKIPPSISNWKNPKGYTIPLDKRLAADGRGLQETAINDSFAKFTEALYMAESSARQASKSTRYFLTRQTVGTPGDLTVSVHVTVLVLLISPPSYGVTEFATLLRLLYGLKSLVVAELALVIMFTSSAQSRASSLHPCCCSCTCKAICPPSLQMLCTGHHTRQL